MQIPFKTPVDYFREVLKSDYSSIDNFKTLFQAMDWDQYDNDLHIYPYTKAVPGMLSVGCPNTCSFCPTALEHKGKIHFGNPKDILSQYHNRCIHFMDENFFYNDMGTILPLLAKQNITWLAMSDFKSTVEVLAQFGEKYLYDCGLRIIEMGLENICLYKKVHKHLKTGQIAVYYLNMTCLPGETKETIQKNAAWMKKLSLEHPIHYNNGVWYACGQFYHPYEYEPSLGKHMDGNLARVLPTWIPSTLLKQKYKIVNLKNANYYNQLIYGTKIYNPKMSGWIADFIELDQKRAAWLLTGIRCGAIK